MANARGKAIDKTHLSIDQAEERGFIHRDYIAHCLRWTHVVKFLSQKQRYKDAQILDIGCGKEVPLAKLMYSSRYIVKKYAGIDVNKMVVPQMFHTGKFPIELYSGDAADLSVEDLGFQPNIVTCFEVLEHVEPAHARDIMLNVLTLADPEADIFISTPNWDPHVGAAANHVNEMRYEALGAMLEDIGYHIQDTWGTFASIKDYKSYIEETEFKAFFEAARGYYDVNYLATIFAPILPPELARNVLWHLKPAASGHDYGIHFNWDSVPEPYTSSDKWQELKA
jgi:2-polyprenyl-3-methyl-5-hydroxy-6-metoxy-1,4-benzoquinol methylase